MKTALTIAGSDSSGGAGIQADIKTMTANGVFALSAITALTAQNTTGVTGIFETTPEFLAQQLDAVFTDIYPDAIKIGMVSSSALIETIAKKLRQYDAKHIVVDPVMVATSGSKLLQDSAIQILTGQLLPMAEVVTPNIPEAEILSGMTITDAAGMEAAAKCISEKYGCAVLCKGGHKVNDADDLLWRNGNGKWDSGNVVERLQPERAEIYANDQGEDTFATKTNWEIEFSMDMNRIFAPVTMQSLSRLLDERESQRLRREAEKRAKEPKTNRNSHDQNNQNNGNGFGSFGGFGGGMNLSLIHI